MSYDKRFAILSLTLLLGGMIFAFSNDTGTVNGYTNHSRITIYTDDDFESLGFPGSGTEEDPYIIENFNITTTSSYGIYIRKTTKYFVIRNCYIKSSSSGIFLSLTGNNTAQIINNTIVGTGSGNGISLQNAPYTFIYNNTISNVQQGIYATSSGGLNVTNNIITVTTYYGFRGYSTEKLTLRNNVFYNGGVKLYENSESVYASFVVENNTVNGKELLYLYNQHDILIDNNAYGQILVFGSDNITITNQNLSRNTIPIYTQYDTNLLIKDSIFSDTAIGIMLNRVTDVRLENLTFLDNYGYGLYVDNGNNISLDNCHFSGGISGIYIRTSNNISITFTKVENQIDDGIYCFSGTLLNLSDSTIENVTNGITLQSFDNVNITKNNLVNCLYTGLEMRPLTDINVTHNTFVNCSIEITGYETYYGLYFENNSVNGLPVAFIRNQHSAVIDGEFGEIIILNSTDITITNQAISAVDSAIIILNSTNICVTNSTFSAFSHQAIRTFDSHNLIFSNLHINAGYFGEYCLLVSYSDGIQINDSRFSYAYYDGVYLETVENASITYNIFEISRGTELDIYEGVNITAYGNDFFMNTSNPMYVDYGENITVYNPDLMLGNCYSDWDGSANYSIEIDEGYLYDIYPINDTDHDTLNDSLEVYLYGTDPFLADSDFDGLDDHDEIDTYSTDPTNSDTDGDGMPDGWELENALDPFVNDATGDSDDDGLTNLEEYLHSTNPQSNDTDSDGMPDDWELHHSLNPLTNDSAQDPDSDGLSNLEEYQLGTNPHEDDTDKDGMPDGWEVQNGLDPLTNDSGDDTDNDNLNNLEEYQHNTDPTNNDTDNDGMPDCWEVQYGLNPLTDDASEDSDGDGLSNLEEYQNGTNPKAVDTDGDGYNDSEEIESGSDPLNEESIPKGSPIALIVGISAGTVLILTTAIIFLLKKKGILFAKKS